MLKILHTADWHLGQRFIHLDRKEEHELALNWLVQLIISEKIEVLIIAGDIFDTGNPPNYAIQQYYDFLKKILGTSCKHIIIIGGNHDSPSMLNAPKDLLHILNVHVIGSIYKNENNQPLIEREIIELKDENGHLKCVIAAVPYLRDRDLKLGIANETSKQREQQIKKSITAHYEAAGKAVEKYKNIPVITTGHLYVAGGEASESEQEIHIGKLARIGASNFPQVFDYVALGHLHRPQIVDEQENIRYSGSLIPLSFSEVKDQKQVLVISFDGKQIKDISPVFIPTSRKLVRLKGNFLSIQEKIQALEEVNVLPSWLEITLELEESIPNVAQKLRQLCEDKAIEILKVKLEQKKTSNIAMENLKDLEDLKVAEVFEKKCLHNGLAAEEINSLKETLNELISLHNESDEV